MIAVDTNVLLRLYSDDEPIQKRAALALLTGVGAGNVRVSVVVLAEIAWALRSVYRLPKPAIADVFLDLLSREELHIECRAAVYAAIVWFQFAKADFADCLIASLNKEAGASPTYTFDLNAASLNAFALVEQEEKKK